MKLKKNIAICGRMHDGKSTVAGILAETYGYSVWHFAEPVKQLADKALIQVVDPYLRDITGKTITPSKAMNRIWYQGVGARGRAYDKDIWVKQLNQRYTRGGAPRGIAIDDMRFTNEAAWASIREFVIIRVRRDEETRLASIKDAFLADYGRKITEWELQAILSHESETEVDKIEFAFLVENNDAHDSLVSQIEKIMEVI